MLSLCFLVAANLPHTFCSYIYIVGIVLNTVVERGGGLVIVVSRAPRGTISAKGTPNLSQHMIMSIY